MSKMLIWLENTLKKNVILFEKTIKKKKKKKKTPNWEGEGRSGE
jgi:hypothetical protein